MKSRNVILQENRDTMQPASWSKQTSFEIERGGLLQGAGVHLYHRTQGRPLVIDFVDPGKVRLRVDQCAESHNIGEYVTFTKSTLVKCPCSSPSCNSVMLASYRSGRVILLIFAFAPEAKKCRRMMNDRQHKRKRAYIVVAV